MSLEVQPTAIIPSLEMNFLEKKCKEINDGTGKRETQYRSILRSFKEKIRSVSQRKDLKELYESFGIVKRLVPPSIKERRKFSLILNQTEKEISNCQDIVNELKDIQKKIEECWNISKLEKLYESIKTIEWQTSTHFLPISGLTHYK
ncbi:hypothetical protein [Neochlamydia sp. AcF65]|uniref:hypothetical protein n=1 Tax=Neochlamydia sp. AcF65 TaxID=2795735 RepID=UPI001BC8CD0A|nr:hypothetical protein [Neochlamydia sp. AcF65]